MKNLAQIFFCFCVFVLPDFVAGLWELGSTTLAVNESEVWGWEGEKEGGNPV